MKHQIDRAMLEQFEAKLNEDEKSRATIKKYTRDMRAFITYIGPDNTVDKETVMAYKKYLGEQYAVSSANSMLAALNYFFRVVGWQECVVKSFKMQRETFRARERDLSREEYVRLLKTAKRQGKEWLYLIMLTICSTGIRVSELEFITVESLHTRRAKVCLKGKTRMVILPVDLCRQLKRYVNQTSITSGSIFVTRNGKPIDRSNIFHGMKKLCAEAHVARSKVFPHNLRHLFAVTYYEKERDICHLADILGHSNVNTTRIYTLISCEEQELKLNDLGLVI